MQLGSVFFCLLLFLTANLSVADSQSELQSEQYFLSTHLEMVKYYQASDQATLDRFKSRCGLASIVYKAVPIVRDMDLFLTGSEAIRAAASGIGTIATATDEATEIAQTMGKYPRLSEFLIRVGANGLVKALDYFNAGGKIDLADVLTQIEQVINDEREIQGDYAIQSTSVERNLVRDQSSYAHYLTSRDKLYAIFNDATQKIDAKPQSFSKIWDYGNDEVAYYDLGEIWGSTFAALNKIEADHLHEVLIKKL
jgi:hypothetical protein